MIKILFLSLLSSVPAIAAQSTVTTQEKIQRSVQDDAAYFLPADPNSLLEWTGDLYEYSSQKCVHLVQAQDGTISSTAIKCSPQLLKLANEPYEKIADFDAFKKKFLSCLDKQDVTCLRHLTWRNVQISFGVDGLGDRRDKLYPTWSKAQFQEAAKLVRKGVANAGERRDFPHPQEPDYIGMRGAFEKKGGAWLLIYYLGGD
jgi:hypothetical protein